MQIVLDNTFTYNHNSPMLDRTMATAKSPGITVRFRSKAEIAKIKKAAKRDGISLNTFVVSRALKAAEEIIASMNRPEVAQPTDAVFQPSSS